MVNPGDIRHAEIYGIDAYEPIMEDCPTCGRTQEEDSLIKCENCGMRCCEECRTYIEKYLVSFCSPECAIKWLLDELERVEDEAHKYWKLQETNSNNHNYFDDAVKLARKQQLKFAAKKAATTGNREDLHNYLKMRRNS